MTTPSTPACTEQANAPSPDVLLPDEQQRALAEAWQALQETLSYVDQQLAQCRGFLESIASQR